MAQYKIFFQKVLLYFKERNTQSLPKKLPILPKKPNSWQKTHFFQIIPNSWQGIPNSCQKCTIIAKKYPITAKKFLILGKKQPTLKNYSIPANKVPILGKIHNFCQKISQRYTIFWQKLPTSLQNLLNFCHISQFSAKISNSCKKSQSMPIKTEFRQ